jgi:putative ABC transport system permease protein
VISDELAHKLFGNQAALGRVVTLQGSAPFTITGVFQTPAQPSHIEADAFRQMSSFAGGWGNANWYMYILTKTGADPRLVENKMDKILDKLPINQDTAGFGRATIRLIPLKDMYFHSDLQYDFTQHGNLHILQVLSIVAILLLAIASINFTNFNIIRSIRRARETGVRKVLGAFRWNLVMYYLLEASIQVLIAMVLGVVWAELILPLMNHLLGLNLSLLHSTEWGNLSLFLGLTLVGVILLSGGYVAYWTSGLNPVIVLKGNLSSLYKGGLLRKGLLIVQFGLAAISVGGLGIIHKQVNYIEHMDPGFNKDQVMILPLHQRARLEHFDDFKKQMLNVPGVRLVSRVNFLPGDKAIQVIGSQYQGKMLGGINMVVVGYDYFETMGTHFIKGRSFNQSFGTDSTSIIVNETAERQFHLQQLLGKPWIQDRPIIGVIKDITQRGFENKQEPTVYVIETDNTNYATNVILKVDGNNLDQTIAGLKAVWSNVEPAFPMEYHFLDEQFAQMFNTYRQMDTVFVIFATLTLFIALLGIFVLAAFMAAHRTKEIGVRKVLGASVLQIIQMLNREFVILVIIANVIALPILYLLGKQWLQGFAYRVTLPWLAFGGTMLITLLCTVITVSIQARAAAIANPVKALKHE